MGNAKPSRWSKLLTTAANIAFPVPTEETARRRLVRQRRADKFAPVFAPMLLVVAVVWTAGVDWRNMESLLVGAGVLVYLATLLLSSLPKIGTPFYYRYFFPAMLEAEGLPVPEGVHPPSKVGRVWYWVISLVGYAALIYLYLSWGYYDFGIPGILLALLFILFFVYLMVINHKRTERIYSEEGLALRKKRRRKGAAGVRETIPSPVRPNQRWSMDFVSDSTVTGRRFRALAIVDDYSRECPAI